MEESKNTGINKHVIELINNQQPLYRPIYALNLVKLEKLKTYIKTHLKTGFIQPSKFLVRASIFFDKKSDGNFRWYINYQGLNNLTIKNRYLLPLIEEFLNQLDRIKQLTS